MVFQFARDAFHRSDIYNRMLRRDGAGQIHALPTDPIPGDPARGADILNGDMVLAARKHALGPHPFGAGLKSLRAASDLHGFGWLRDIAALSAPTAREGAQALLRDWLRHEDRWNPITWSPGTTAARLLSWITYIDFATERDSTGLRDEMAQSIAAQARHLLRSGAQKRNGDATLTSEPAAGAALIAAGVAQTGMETFVTAGIERLRTAVQREILDDGGHHGRSPETALAFMVRLIQARNALETGRQPLPDFLRDALQRMTPAIKSWVMGDGRLASFNGGGIGSAAEISAILAAGRVRSSAASSLRESRFERLHAGTTTIVADTGGDSAHAGALSFEMSSGRHRLVVNCGAHPDETTEWSRVLTSTAAHSTLSINDTDALPIGDDKAEIAMSVRRNEREGSTLVQVGHAGYLGAFGVVHSRDLYLSGAGDDFRGKDSLVGGSGAFCIRFHLHPEVGASALEGGRDVLLKQPSGKGWRFRGAGAEVSLEESVYLGDPSRPRRCGQIVLRGEHNAPETAVRWSFLREGN